MQLSELEAIELHRKWKDLKVENGKTFKTHQNLCVEKFGYIIRLHAFPYKKYTNYNDIIQEGFISLMQAFESYDETKGNFFYWIHQYVSLKAKRSAGRYAIIQIPIKQARKDKSFKAMFRHFFQAEKNATLEEMFKKDCYDNLLNESIDSLSDDDKKFIKEAYDLDSKRPLEAKFNDLKMTESAWYKRRVKIVNKLKLYFNQFI